jgi:hypothetical protein
MAERLDHPDDKGRLALDAGAVWYTRAGKIVWTVPLHRLRVIGEYTTDGGPWFDDYFIVLVAANPFETLVAPVEAEGTLLADLSDRLGVVVSHGLANRPDFASRVLWPPELRDRPLFDFHQVPRSPSLWSRAKDVLSPLIDLEPTAEVRRCAGA